MPDIQYHTINHAHFCHQKQDELMAGWSTKYAPDSRQNSPINGGQNNLRITQPLEITRWSTN